MARGRFVPLHPATLRALVGAVAAHARGGGALAADALLCLVAVHVSPSHNPPYRSINLVLFR